MRSPFSLSSTARRISAVLIRPFISMCARPSRTRLTATFAAMILSGTSTISIPVRLRADSFAAKRIFSASPTKYASAKPAAWAVVRAARTSASSATATATRHFAPRFACSSTWSKVLINKKHPHQYCLACSSPANTRQTPSASANISSSPGQTFTGAINSTYWETSLTKQSELARPPVKIMASTLP